MSISTPAGSNALEPLHATPAIPSATTTALALAINQLLRLIPSLLGANETRPICVCWPLKCPWCAALRPLCDGRLHMIGDVTHPTLMNRILMAVVRRTQRGATSRLQPNRAPIDRSNTHAPVPPIISRHQRKPIRSAIRSASSAIAAVLLMALGALGIGALRRRAYCVTSSSDATHAAGSHGGEPCAHRSREYIRSWSAREAEEASRGA